MRQRFPFAGLLSIRGLLVTARHALESRRLYEQLVKVLEHERTVALVLIAALATASLAPLGPLTFNRFHQDEAIYSSWGLDIASGRDLLISGSAVDKPPFFPYVQALSFLLFGPTEVAARLPSLIASVVSVGLLYALGRSLYGLGVGLLAAWLLATSPFAILFAPTAFTDPLMLAWILAGCLAAVRGGSAWAGCLLGLASITKQQGLLFLPLVWGLGRTRNQSAANRKFQTGRFLAVFAAVFALAVIWDIARARRPGFLAQSWINYGGLSILLATTWQRLLGFAGLLQYGIGSTVLNIILVVGLPLLVAGGLVRLSRSKVSGRGGESTVLSGARTDLILVTFILLFLVGHSLVAFAVWDRYLLGLIPLLALLIARVLTLPWRLFRSVPLFNIISLVFALSMVAFTLRPAQDAAASRFPIGGDHGGYQGIEQIVDYLKMVPGETTLYHHWLGWHWRFYLWGSPYDFRHWTSPADLAAQAAARPGSRRYIVFPSWQSSTEAQLSLKDAGLTMQEVQRAFRDDGSISFVLYRIEEAP